MNIDFTETARALERGDFFTNGAIVVVVALFVIMFVVAIFYKQILERKRPKAVAYTVVALLAVTAFTFMVLTMKSEKDASRANVTAVQEAAKDTYGLTLSRDDSVDLVNYYGGSGKFFSPVLANEEISDDLMVFGSTKVEDTNGEIIDVALVARDGGYELVGGEGRYVELPKAN